MIRTMIIMGALIFQAPSSYDFYVSVEAISAPLHYPLWKITIYRDSSGTFIVSDKYRDKTYRKRLDTDLFLEKERKCIQLGVRNFKTDFPDTSPSEKYVIEYVDRGMRNRAVFENMGPRRTASENASEVIRIVENLAAMTIMEIDR
jgi:hypothetical protein